MQLDERRCRRRRRYRYTQYTFRQTNREHLAVLMCSSVVMDANERTNIDNPGDKTINKTNGIETTFKSL